MGDISTALGHNFTAADVPPDEYELVVAGDYVAIITEAAFRDTSTGGKMLEVMFQLQTSSFEGRILTERLNLVNKSEKAVEIAQKTLAKIVTAAGMLTIGDSSELISRRMKIKVDIKPGVGTYMNKFGEEKESQAQNVIKGYYPMSEAPAAPTTVETQQPAPPEPVLEPADAPPVAESGSRPWAT